MARIRSIHPGLWTDEAFAAMSPCARLLAIGIWNECDDQGIFEWKPVTLKMRILPVDNADVRALLVEIEEANIVQRYSIAGREYGAVRNFGRYQRPKKPKKVHPTTPEIEKYIASGYKRSEPDDDEGGSSSEPSPHSSGASSPPVPPVSIAASPPVPHQFPTSGEKSGQMEEGGDRKKDNRSLRSLPRRQASEADFEQFWSAYPRKVGRGAARKAFDIATRSTPLAEIAEGLNRQRWPAETRFIPHAATWLNQGRWQDDPTAAAPDRTPEPRRDLHAESVAKLFDDLGIFDGEPEVNPHRRISH